MLVMVYRYQNKENIDILTEIMILTDFDQISTFRPVNMFLEYST